MELGKFFESDNEIVLKMIIYKDYQAQLDAVVKIFDNKIKFNKLGKLFDQISFKYTLKKNYKL